jgi:DNA-binding MarR family transcriptional regulator
MEMLVAGTDETEDETGAEVRSDLLDGLVGYRLRRAATRMMADFAAKMGHIGVRPSSFVLLAMIGENPGINQTTLGRSLGIQRANLVPIIAEMESRGLIDRRPAANDKRAFALHLSEEGFALLEAAVQRVRPHEERMLACLGKDERKLLLDMLGRIA